MSFMINESQYIYLCNDLFFVLTKFCWFQKWKTVKSFTEYEKANDRMASAVSAKNLLTLSENASPKAFKYILEQCGSFTGKISNSIQNINFNVQHLNCWMRSNVGSMRKQTERRRQWEEREVLFRPCKNRGESVEYSV